MLLFVKDLRPKLWVLFAARFQLACSTFMHESSKGIGQIQVANLITFAFFHLAIIDSNFQRFFKVKCDNDSTWEILN